MMTLIVILQALTPSITSFGEQEIHSLNYNI